MIFEYNNELRYVPSGKEEDILKSPVFYPLGFNINNDIVDKLNASLRQLFSTRQKNVDKSIISRHLLTTLVQYLYKK